MKAFAAALLLLVALAGCASLNAVDSDVSSYSRWPAGRTPSSYAFDRLPSQQANPQQAQVIEAAARGAVEAAGFVPASEGAIPDVTVQVGARVTEFDPAPFDDAFWYGRLGPFRHSFFYGRYGRPFFGPRWPGPGRIDDFPYVEREVGVLIRDKPSSQPLYEAHAISNGSSLRPLEVLPAMFAAAMGDFPNGSTTHPHPVRIPAH